MSYPKIMPVNTIKYLQILKGNLKEYNPVIFPCDRPFFEDITHELFVYEWKVYLFGEIVKDIYGNEKPYSRLEIASIPFMEVHRKNLINILKFRASEQGTGDEKWFLFGHDYTKKGSPFCVDLKDENTDYSSFCLSPAIYISSINGKPAVRPSEINLSLFKTEESFLDFLAKDIDNCRNLVI